MTYKIDIRVHQDKKRTYKIDAKNEAEAIKRLMTRLAPSERNDVIVDSVEPDPSSFQGDDAFGVFLNDNHS